jgi:hypothetical protein
MARVHRQIFRTLGLITADHHAQQRLRPQKMDGITTDDIRGPIHTAEAITRIVLAAPDRDQVNDALLQFFELVYDQSGYRRPTGLYGYPPGPPRP